MEKDTKKISYDAALNRAQALCARQEKCSFDIKQKLHIWGVADIDTKKVIDHLIKDGFINDERYAFMFVRDKSKFNKWGPLKIAQALRIKHIPEAIIQHSLKEIDKSLNENDLLDLLKKKSKSVKAKSDYDLKVKLIRFAISRGFDYNQILKLVDKV